MVLTRVAIPSRTGVTPRTLLDLDSIKFLQGGHFMANRKTIVPEGAYRTQKKGYEEVHVPATKVRARCPRT